MSACVVEEGRDEGGGSVEESEFDEIERPRREVLLSARGRRACSEQGPHQSHYMRKCSSINQLLLNSFFI